MGLVVLLIQLLPAFLLAVGQQRPQLGPSAEVRRANSPATASITGVVRSAGANDAIAGVRVTVAPTSYSDGAPLPVVTDNEGRFVVKGLDGGEYGTYRIQFQANGYLSQAYGQTTFPGVGTPITLGVGQALSGLVMTMTPTGSVSGRIRDTAGRPLPGVPVYLVQSRFDYEGKQTLQRSGYARSDDRGEYRIYWTSPGRYVLAAGGATTGPGSLSGGTDMGNKFPNELPEATVPVFYPNASDLSTATTIDVRAGDETQRIDFALRPLALYRASGRFALPVDGQPPAGAQVAVTSQTLLGVQERHNGFYDPVTGKVEARNLPPGQYQILVTLQDSAARGRPFSSRTMALLEVRIVDADVDNLVWAIATPAVIEGRITVDGAVPPPTPQLQFSLMPTNPTVYPLGQPDASGNFRLENVLPGEYKVSFSPPAPYYVKEVRFGGTDIAGRPFRFDGTVSGRMEILLGSRGAQVEGTVVDDRLRPSPLTQIILVPERDRDRIDLFKMARTDANGRFRISNVRPGDYRVFAWEAIEPASWFDPAVLKQFEQRGRSVRLTEASNEVVEVRVVPAGAKQ